MAARRWDTDGYICVLVEDDLKEMRREDGRGFEVLLWSEDVLLLPIRTRRRAGQICKQTRVNIGLVTGTPVWLCNKMCIWIVIVFTHIFAANSLLFWYIWHEYNVVLTWCVRTLQRVHLQGVKHLEVRLLDMDQVVDGAQLTGYNRLQEIKTG